MNDIIERDSLDDNGNEPVFQAEFSAMDFCMSDSDSAVRSITFRRQIEIMQENKLLMSSLKDVYEF